MSNFPHRFAITLIIWLGAAATQAMPVFEYSVDNPRGSKRAGDIKHISTRYDGNTNMFSWSYSIDDGSDGFWLVVNDGKNPKRRAGQMAILYGDLAANRLSAYEYHGKRGRHSYRHQALLGSWDNAFKLDSSKPGLLGASFAIDVSTINDHRQSKPWQGIAFNEQIGIWFHPSKNSRFSYDGKNLKRYAVAHRKHGGGTSWYDASHKPTSTATVPEPGTIALLTLGVAGLGLSRRGERKRRELEQH